MSPDSNEVSVVPIRRLAMAVDSHSWEDFPSYHLGNDAAEVLSGWTALWHPLLIKSAGSIPTWLQTDVWPEQPEQLLLVVPSFAIDNLPEKTHSRLSDLGGRVVTSQVSRGALNESILEAFGATNADHSWDPIIVQDFYSLGYCYLQVQLMTRQLRHSSGIDDDVLWKQVEKALQAIAPDGQLNPDSREDYRSAIQSCFDLLIEERSRYYPTMASLVDYVLLTPKTLGKALRETLRQSNPLSIQASGETVEAILEDEELSGMLKNRIEQNTLTVAGGDFSEQPSALLPSMRSVENLRKGIRSLEKLTGKKDDPVYARRSFGLRVGLPALLEQFGIDCVVHSTMDDGVFPQTSGHHIRWEGDDHTTVDGLVAPPLVAGQAETWLSFAVRIGEMIDVNHYATMFLVHWPGQTHEAYHDLIHSCRFGAVLGSFVTLETYFDEASDPGFSQNYSVDDYRGPWLPQMVDSGQPDPISRFVKAWREHAVEMQQKGWHAMQAVCGTDLNDQTKLNSLESIEPESSERVSLVNPLSFSRVVKVPFAVADHPALLLSDQNESLVRIPGMGFVTVARNTSNESPGDNNDPDLASELLLQNEHFQVEVNSATGGIAAIRKHNSRTNMLSQQLALRTRSQRQSRSGGSDVRYSKMVADDIQVLSQTRVEAKIRSTGSLMLDDRSVGTFQQTLCLRRGQPIVQIEVAVDLLKKLSGHPWQNYFASRFAWDDSSAILSSWQNDSRHPLSRPRIIAPTAIEIDQEKFTTSILTGGLPFHQRIGERQIDSLLVVAGESQREFRLAVGLNLPHPDRVGLSFLSDVCTGSLEHLPAIEDASVNHAWLFHLNCKNVMALDWRLTNSNSGRPGIQVLLKETAGRPANLSLSCFRSLESAQHVLINGTWVRDLEVSQDRVSLTMSPLEMKLVELFW